MSEHRLRLVSELLVGVFLILSVNFVLIEWLLSDSPDEQAFYFLPMIGYVLFPLLLSSVFFAAYAHSRGAIGAALRNRRVRLLSAATGAGYAAFYILATGTVSLFDTYPGPGYLVWTLLYGPMVVWPGVIFFSPSLAVFGYFTIGNVTLIASLGILVTLASALVIDRASAKSRNVAGAFAGTFAAQLFTNVSCCASAAILPVIGAIVGSGVESSLVLYLMPGGPFYDLLIMANLASLLAGILLSTRRSAR